LHTAAPCNALQRPATHGNTLQLAATHCWLRWCGWCRLLVYYMLQHTAAHCNARQRMATHGNALQIAATHFWLVCCRWCMCRVYYSCATYCSTLQHTATHCSALQLSCCGWGRCLGCCILQHTAARRNTLQRATTHCNTSQRNAQRCNTCRRQTLEFDEKIMPHSACGAVQGGVLHYVALWCSVGQFPSYGVAMIRRLLQNVGLFCSI